MAPKCAACGKFMTKDSAEAASCNICHSVYHLACVGVQDKSKIAASWACPECKAKLPRNNNDDTPIKNPSERDFASCASRQNLCMSPIDNSHDITVEFSVAEELKLLREVFKDELSGMRKEFQEVRRELSKVSSSLLLCNKRIDDLESRVTNVEAQCNKRMDDLALRIASVEKQTSERSHSDPTGVEGTIAQLKAELNDRDQEILLNDIDITGIPEEKTENLVHIASLIAAKIGVTVTESDIVRAERVGPARGGRDEGSARPIVVRLARRALRDDLLRAARVRRGATTSDMNLPGPPRRFYINERLTKINRQLFNKARVAAKNCKWKFTWTRDGRIYSRKSEGQTGVRIKTDQDIIRVFGTESIQSNF